MLMYQELNADSLAPTRGKIHAVVTMIGTCHTDENWLRDVAVAIDDVNDSDRTILNRGLVLVGIA